MQKEIKEQKMNNNKIIISLFILSVLAISAFPVKADDVSHWYSSGWLYRKLLTIDHTKVWSSTGIVLNNFPIMINFTDNNLMTNAQTTGNDILFILYSDNITKLSHEIEYYSNTNGALLAWVNIPSLSSTTDTKIWMYYGNPSCGSQQNIYGTWNNGYLGVYHMDGSSYSAIVDSTSNKNNATGVRGIPLYQQTGKLRYSVYFDGTDDSIILPQIYVGGSPNTNRWTLSCWANADTTMTTNSEYLLTQYTTNGFSMVITTTPKLIAFMNSTTVNSLSIVKGRFQYYTDWRNDTKICSYVNTTKGDTTVSSGLKNPYVVCSFNISDRNDGTREFKGYIDEVRLSNIARNDSWQYCDFNTMSSPSTFISVGSQNYNPMTYVAYGTGNNRLSSYLIIGIFSGFLFGGLISLSGNKKKES